MKCCITWIDPKTGEGTPDQNDAVGLAICETLMARDVEVEGHVRAFPICAVHLKRLYEIRRHVAWPGTPDEIETRWTFVPFGPNGINPDAPETR